MTEMVIYDRMVTAIAECHRVDELKEIHNKALALQLYAKQAKNVEAERRATEVRLRAERRVGTLLLDLKRTPPQDSGKLGRDLQLGLSNDRTTPTAPSEYAASLEAAQISPQTGHRWQQLAKVPEAEFEAAIADPTVTPSTAELLRRGGKTEKPSAPVKRMDRDALAIWGELRDVEKITSRRSPAQLFPQMTEPMLADCRRIIPSLLDWLNQAQEHTNG